MLQIKPHGSRAAATEPGEETPGDPGRGRKPAPTEPAPRGRATEKRGAENIFLSLTLSLGILPNFMTRARDAQMW